jgi:hypothetical protein
MTRGTQKNSRVRAVKAYRTMGLETVVAVFSADIVRPQRRRRWVENLPVESMQQPAG